MASERIWWIQTGRVWLLFHDFVRGKIILLRLLHITLCRFDLGTLLGYSIRINSERLFEICCRSRQQSLIATYIHLSTSIFRLRLGQIGVQSWIILGKVPWNFKRRILGLNSLIFVRIYRLRYIVQHHVYDQCFVLICQVLLPKLWC